MERRSGGGERRCCGGWVSVTGSVPASGQSPNRSDEAAADGFDSCFGARGDVEFAIEVLDVAGDRAFGEAEVSRRIGDPHAFADASQYFCFSA